MKTEDRLNQIDAKLNKLKKAFGEILTLIKQAKRELKRKEQEEWQKKKRE